MIKSKELADPNSCMSRARDDEMTFVLLGRDAAAPRAIRAWIEERINSSKNKPEDEQIKEAEECARAMARSQIPKPDDLKDRLKAFYVEPSTVLTLLGGWRRFDFIRLPKLGLPDDAEAVEITYDTLARGFILVVRSASFDVAKAGTKLPLNGFLPAFEHVVIHIPKEQQLP